MVSGDVCGGVSVTGGTSRGAIFSASVISCLAVAGVGLSSVGLVVAAVDSCTGGVSPVAISGFT